MKLTHLDEPLLEFSGGKHIDIRFGIMNYGPLDVESPVAPKSIGVGIVGTTESIDGVRSWLERCRGEISAKPDRQDPTKPIGNRTFLHGSRDFNPDHGFRSNLVLEDSLCRSLPKSEFTAITRLADRNERIRRCVGLFMEEIRYIAQNTTAPVIMCAVPLPLLEAMGIRRTQCRNGRRGR